MLEEELKGMPKKTKLFQEVQIHQIMAKKVTEQISVSHEERRTSHQIEKKDWADGVKGNRSPKRQRKRMK